MPNVKERVLDYIQREYRLPENIDVDSFNFVKTGYVDSIGIIQFIVLLEEEFGIEFSDEELSDVQYQVIGEFVKLIENKIESNKDT